MALVEVGRPGEAERLDEAGRLDEDEVVAVSGRLCWFIEDRLVLGTLRKGKVNVLAVRVGGWAVAGRENSFRLSLLVAGSVWVLLL